VQETQPVRAIQFGCQQPGSHVSGVISAEFSNVTSARAFDRERKGLREKAGASDNSNYGVWFGIGID
jgi:hypothetical protein